MTTNRRTADLEALTQVLQLAANTRFTAAEQRMVREGMTRWAEQLGTVAGQALRGVGAAVAQHYAPAIRMLTACAAAEGVPVDEHDDEGQDDEQHAEPWIDDDHLATAYAESGAEAVSDAEDGPRPDQHIAGLRGVLNLERARHAREVREARRQAARYWQQEARTAYRERDEVRAALAVATRGRPDLAAGSSSTAVLVEPTPNLLAALDNAARHCAESTTTAANIVDGGELETLARWLRAAAGESQPPEPGDQVVVAYDATYAAPAAVRGHYVVVRDGDHGHQTFVPDGARITPVAAAKGARS